MYNKIRISVLGLLRNESDSVLLVYKERGPEPNCWDLPGGGLKPGEKLQHALLREVKEETGLNEDKIKIQDFLTASENFFEDWGENGLHSLSIVYKGTIKEDSIKNSPAPITNTDVDKAEWFKITEIEIESCSERCKLALQKAELI